MIYLFIGFILFLSLHNFIKVVEGATVAESANNPHLPPSVGPQADREDVALPPLEPQPNKEIKPVVPEKTDPLIPSCACFDTQTEIYLSRNSHAFQQLKRSVDVLKQKIKKLHGQITKNYEDIEQNKKYDVQMCCATGQAEACKTVNNYDCSSIIKL